MQSQHTTNLALGTNSSYQVQTSSFSSETQETVIAGEKRTTRTKTAAQIFNEIDKIKKRSRETRRAGRRCKQIGKNPVSKISWEKTSAEEFSFHIIQLEFRAEDTPTFQIQTERGMRVRYGLKTQSKGSTAQVKETSLHERAESNQKILGNGDWKNIR